MGFNMKQYRAWLRFDEGWEDRPEDLEALNDDDAFNKFTNKFPTAWIVELEELNAT